jgi:phage anti-repressor protein
MPGYFQPFACQIFDQLNLLHSFELLRSDLPLFLCEVKCQIKSTAAKSGSLIASSSGNELPIIQQGENLLIEARLLHQNLKVTTRFNDWINRRIEEFGFEPGKDFYSNLSNQKHGKDRIETHLTLDMAKELAMVERNDIGRQIRRYFIQKEKEARGISHLPAERSLFTGLKPKKVNDRLMYPYKAVLERCGYSTKAGTGQRKARYWMHFVKEGRQLYITQEFALHLYRQRQVINNRAVMLNMQPVLPFNFGDPKQLAR